jgi:hypothetical protein
MTMGIDLGDIWSHYSTLNEEGEVVERGRFRTTLSGVDPKLFRSPPDPYRSSPMPEASPRPNTAMGTSAATGGVMIMLGLLYEIIRVAGRSYLPLRAIPCVGARG